MAASSSGSVAETELLDIGVGVSRGLTEGRRGSFKRLLILPGHCCCHQVGHVTELCILKEKRGKKKTSEGRVKETFRVL